MIVSDLGFVLGVVEIDDHNLALCVRNDRGSQFLQFGNTCLFLGGSRLLLARFMRQLSWLIRAFILCAMSNGTFWQSLLQLGNACVSDWGIIKSEPLQLCQPLEVYQSGVSDLGADEPELLQLGHPLKVHQLGVSDLGFVLGVVEIDDHNLALCVRNDRGSQFLQFGNTCLLQRGNGICFGFGSASTYS